MVDTKHEKMTTFCYAFFLLYYNHRNNLLKFLHLKIPKVPWATGTIHSSILKPTRIIRLHGAYRVKNFFSGISNKEKPILANFKKVGFLNLLALIWKPPQKSHSNDDIPDRKFQDISDMKWTLSIYSFPV